MKPRFPDRLDITEAGNRNGSELFAVIRPFRFFSSLGDVFVPRGFITDGASVPRPFWTIFPPYGPYFKAAVIHDFLYSAENDEFTRDEADFIFLEAMETAGVRFLARHTIHKAVRLFGWRAFKGSPLEP